MGGILVFPSLFWIACIFIIDVGPQNWSIENKKTKKLERPDNLNVKQKNYRIGLLAWGKESGKNKDRKKNNIAVLQLLFIHVTDDFSDNGT